MFKFAFKSTIATCALIVAVSSASEIFAQTVPRTILALYDSSEADNTGISKNRIHRFAEMPLNYMGYRLRFHDIQSGIPSDSFQDIAAVMSWFEDDRMKDPEAFLNFIQRVSENEIKYIMIDRPGFLENESGDASDLNLIKQTFRLLGFNYEDSSVESSIQVVIEDKDATMVEFERSLDGEVQSYLSVTPTHPKNTKVYLRLRLRGESDSISTPVAITEKAGIVLGNYMLFLSNDNRAKWRIDPFRFFSEALENKQQPRYDTTTRNGKRIFYSHIDGDGFRNMYYPDPTRICGEIIFNEILKKYPLPVTVSFITSELEENYFGTQTLRDLAIEILNLPNVEPAVHAFSHPLDWKKQLTAFEIKDYSYPIKSPEFEDLFETTAYKNAFVIKASEETYIKREVDDAVAFINEMIRGSGKKVELYLWSGNTAPNEATIKRVYDLGIPNMNGGDSRFDSWSHSYTSVAPLTRQQGSYIQVYSSNANENIYTHGWQGPYYAFNNVIQTFENTDRYDAEKNRYLRVSPINIYYHFYIGERKTSLRSIKTVYDYALNQDIHPMFASSYAEVVQGFMSGKMTHHDDGSWTFSDYKKCRTVRFDDVSGYPDLERSIGVDGFYRIHNVIYVHLSNRSFAQLYWTSSEPLRAYLSESDASVDDLVIQDDTISFSTQPLRPSNYTFHQTNPNQLFEVRWMDENEKLLQLKKVTSSKDGTLHIELEHPGSYKIKVTKI